jgi:hypothetical protein
MRVEPSQIVEPASAYRLRPSACKHAQQDVIPSHEMVVERRADVRGHQTEPCDADHAANKEKLLGEYPVLGSGRQQLE